MPFFSTSRIRHTATCKILLTASLSIKKFRSAAGYELSDLQVIVIVSSVVYSGRNPMISGPFCGFTEIKSHISKYYLSFVYSINVTILWKYLQWKCVILKYEENWICYTNWVLVEHRIPYAATHFCYAICITFCDIY